MATDTMIKGGMVAYRNTQGFDDKLAVAPDQPVSRPFGLAVPCWEIAGHTLDYEKTCGLPALQWEQETYYKGNDTNAAQHVLWDEVMGRGRDHIPYVLFIYHWGELYRRLDMC